MFQRKQQAKNPEELSDLEIGNLPGYVFLISFLNCSLLSL